ncbi:protein Skeletor, isoforms B/C [Folsomia candida]|uniref:protein Skeletor, isoforms B/C n=1 Tax=Folsomia candida TaxID=158441 RepID=UPI000B9047BA|nr:protein Skeletor, isoforms B/C [Folsomia candida]XP_035713287.1 protein Skeletor, isoforms B/C [Folsomia candida]
MASFAYCGRTLFLRFSLIVLAFFSVDSVAGQASSSSSSGSHYRGRYIGPITAQKHKVSGEVYAVDSRTLHIRGFTYDGTGPDAFFWTGFTEHPSSQGVIIPNERGTKEVLGAYNNQDITISLPDGLTLRDIKWIAVWCRAYEVNFGDLYIPLNLDYPQPHVVGSLVGQQGVTSGPIVVVDAQTILVPDFTYDGQAPDLHFWVGRGVPGPQGVRVPDETGTDGALQKADKKTMVLSLPGDLTVFDVDYFGVWCRLYSIDFGHVRITPGLNVPPSLRMLGVAPQSKLNCEVLHEDAAFEIRWSVVESGETIVFQLVGRLDNGKYMAVGLSGEDDRSVMLGGDAMVGYFDQAAQRGNVVDYHLGGKSVCQQNNKGACPDVRFKEGANNVRLLSAASVNGFTILTFQRKLQPLDGLDKKIRTNESQPIIWAIGNLMPDNLAGYHEIRNRDDISIDFGRSPKWNCPEPEKEPEFVSPPPPPSPTLTTTASPLTTVEQDTSASHQQQKEDVTIIPPAWRIPPIPCSEPDDGVFYLHVGPIGRPDIFKGVTGKKDLPETVWYVNGLLMPEIHLVRGKNYTFVIQGGPDNGFYITDSQTGDYQHAQFDPSRRPGIFGGVELDPLGNGRPTALGKLCRWVETKTESPNAFASYAAYQRTLSLDCAKGHSGILSFTPDKRTPNLVYYQSFSRPNMGWKIHITDHCGAAPTNETPQIQHVIDQNIGESSRVEAFFPQQQQQPNIVALSDMTHQMNSHIPQNAYIIDTTTMDGSGSSFLPHFIFKGNNKLASPPQSQAAPPQRYNGNGLTFPFPPQSAPGVYQIAVDTTSPDNHPHRSQPGFSPQIVPDTHFLRRNGPPPPPPPTMQPYQYAPQSESNYFQGGPTRPPPPQVRYEPQQQQYNNNHQQYHPHPQQQQPVMYVTTMAPQQQYHHQFVTTMGPLPLLPPSGGTAGCMTVPQLEDPKVPPGTSFNMRCIILKWMPGSAPPRPRLGYIREICRNGRIRAVVM